MQLTRAADYAVRVMVQLAALPAGARATRDTLAAASEVPEHFLSKILQTLSRARLIVSHRGAAGGFELSRTADSITLLEVVEAVEGPTTLNVCLEDGPSCGRKNWCSVHPVWAEAQDALVRVLRGATIERLALDAERNQNRCGGAPWT